RWGAFGPAARRPRAQRLPGNLSMPAALASTRDADGVAVLRSSGGAFGPAALEVLGAQVEACLDDPAVSGAVLAAGPDGFFGELDLDWLHAAAQGPRAALEAVVEKATALANRIDAARKPFVAAIDGRAHGIGLELALACQRRIGAQDPACTV